MSSVTGSLTAQGIPTPQVTYPYVSSSGTAISGNINGLGNYGTTITIDPNLWGNYGTVLNGTGWSTPGYNTVIIPTQIVYFTIGEDTKSKEDEATLMSHFLDIIGDTEIVSTPVYSSTRTKKNTRLEQYQNTNDIENKIEG